MKTPWSLGLIVFALAGAVSAAEASVTVRGRVEYWDRLAHTYRPAKNVHVEVEGDWWWRSDPDVQTNSSGDYSATVDDPPWWWNNYDHVDIEAYAETPGKLQVFEHMFAWWPYHAISREVNDVNSGRTVTIDMRIGGP